MFDFQMFSSLEEMAYTLVGFGFKRGCDIMTKRELHLLVVILILIIIIILNN